LVNVLSIENKTYLPSRAATSLLKNGKRIGDQSQRTSLAPIVAVACGAANLLVLLWLFFDNPESIC
jgi:hypothetical protein